MHYAGILATRTSVLCSLFVVSLIPLRSFACSPVAGVGLRRRVCAGALGGRSRLGHVLPGVSLSSVLIV